MGAIRWGPQETCRPTFSYRARSWWCKSQFEVKKLSQKWEDKSTVHFSVR